MTAWRVHIGAHKTATTHLQDVLEACRPSLLAGGVDFIPRHQSRLLRFHNHTGRGNWRLMAGGMPMRRRMAAMIEPYRSGPGTVILSDENIPGLATALLGGPFYPQAEERLQPFAALARAVPVTLFVSIRSPDTLLPSAYAQVLRSRPMPGGFEPIRRQALADPPRWQPFIDRLSRAVPDAHIKFWRFETYRQHDRAILSRFTGVDLPELPPIEAPSSTRSPSAEAMARIEALDPKPTPEAYAAAVAQIIDTDTGADQYAPFSAVETECLRKAHEADIENIRRLHPDMECLDGGSPAQDQTASQPAAAPRVEGLRR